MLAGYVHKHNGQLEEARADFTKALERDPDVVTAYVNRGYVLHDLRESRPAAADFEAAIKRDPKNGEAHLGLAYANLDLRRSQLALKESQLAERYLGDSEAPPPDSRHSVRAEGSVSQGRNRISSGSEVLAGRSGTSPGAGERLIFPAAVPRVD